MTEPAIDPAIRAALESSGVEFEVFPCDPGRADTAEFCRHYGYPMDRSANTILVKAKTGGERFVACVVLAHTRLDVNRVVRKRLGARRVSFASGDETMAITGMAIGGVTPLALPPALELWVDERVMAPEWIILGAGTRSAKIRVAPRIFGATPNTSIVPGLALEPTS